MSDAIVIVSAARTPVGGFQGTLAAATAAELGGVAIRAALERSCLPAAEVDELLMGCVLPAGTTNAISSVSSSRSRACSRACVLWRPAFQSTIRFNA
jgi:acetyl-CoA acetyltransferase